MLHVCVEVRTSWWVAVVNVGQLLYHTKSLSGTQVSAATAEHWYESHRHDWWHSGWPLASAPGKQTPAVHGGRSLSRCQPARGELGTRKTTGAEEERDVIVVFSSSLGYLPKRWSQNYAVYWRSLHPGVWFRCRWLLLTPHLSLPPITSPLLSIGAWYGGESWAEGSHPLTQWPWEGRL